MSDWRRYTEISRIAYFSMEIGLTTEIPTYSGGLGVLAGDTIKSAADLKLPLVAVTLLSRKGYFKQTFSAEGWQQESDVDWKPEELLELLPSKALVNIENRDVKVQAWMYRVKSPTGGDLPVLFLDTDIPGNLPEDRQITDHLYGGGRDYRLKQEIVLGIGGARLLQILGFQVRKYHLNEGHASLLLDYSGCGASSGAFADGTLSRWREEVLALIEATIDGPVVVIGSSMGGWLMLLVGEALGERRVLLANAPHIIRPLEFVLPHVPALRPAWMIRIGLWLLSLIHISEPTRPY